MQGYSERPREHPLGVGPISEIAQPYVDLGVTLGDGMSANFGNWDSIHSTSPSGHWYESDYYAPLRELRQGASKTDIYVVEGVEL